MTAGNKILDAAHFASAAHNGQVREVTGDPYDRHLGRVASRVSLFTVEEYGLDADEDLVVTAWLHDTLEDTKVTHEEIAKRFGSRVAHGVWSLTNRFTSKAHPEMKRSARKAAEFERLMQETTRVRAIKLVDRMDNLRELDPSKDFASVYAGESDGFVQLGHDLPRLATELRGELMRLRSAISTARAMKAVVTDEDLVAIFDDVKNEAHPDCWSHCGQSQVVAMVKELQDQRAADKRVAKVLSDFSQPNYVPLHSGNAGYSAHHHVVKVIKAVMAGDPEYESYWRS